MIGTACTNARNMFSRSDQFQLVN